MFMREYNVGFT